MRRLCEKEEEEAYEKMEMDGSNGSGSTSGGITHSDGSRDKGCDDGVLYLDWIFTDVYCEGTGVFRGCGPEYGHSGH